MPKNTLDRVWLALMVATLMTFWLGESGLAGRAGLAGLVIMFCLAWGKGLLVILHFMELRRAPALWRRLMVGWLTFITVTIVLIHTVSLLLA